MIYFIIASCIILIINTGEDNRINQQTTRNCCDDFVYSSPYYDINNISTGHKNAWDALIFHSFDLSQEIKKENFILERNEISANLVGCHTSSSTEICNYPRTLNETKNENSCQSTKDFITDIQEIMETEENLGVLITSELRVSDQSDIDEVFINTQSTKKRVFINQHEMDEIKHSFNIDHKFKRGLKRRRDVIHEKYLRSINMNIKEHMFSNIIQYHREFYEKRLETINRSFEHFDQNYLKIQEEDAFLTSLDQQFLTSLNRLYLKFRQHKVFDQNTCNSFLIEFDFHFSNQMIILPLEKTHIPVGEYIHYYFYLEMMELYKYIHEMPELLILSGLFTERLYCEVSFVLHVMNLFFNYIGRPKDSRIFILCMIYKALSCSPRKSLDVFSLLKLTPFCSKKHLHLHIFLWDLNPRKRKNIKKRSDQGKSFNCKVRDETQFKTILAIFIYQYIEFLIFYNFDEGMIDYCCSIIKCALHSKVCFACYFEGYLEIIKENIRIVK